MGQPSQRLAAGTHPLLVDGAVGRHAAGHPDVLPRRPAVRPRPDLPIGARAQLAERLIATYDHSIDDRELGPRLPMGHRAARTGTTRDASDPQLDLGQTPSQTVGPYFTMRLSGEGENVLTHARDRRSTDPHRGSSARRRPQAHRGCVDRAVAGDSAVATTTRPMIAPTFRSIRRSPVSGVAPATSRPVRTRS